MRISTVVVLSFILIHTSAFAQDLIVNSAGDSLNCKIIRIKDKHIFFSFSSNNEVKQGIIQLQQVRYYQEGFYPNSEIIFSRPFLGESNYKFRIGAYGGWSYLLARINENINSDLLSYMKDLKSGYHYGADFTVFKSENIGFGGKYSMFRTSNQLENVYVVSTTNGQIRTGILRDDIRIQYFGPAICTRLNTSNPNANVLLDFSLGYMTYKNNATLIEDFTLQSDALGLMWNVGIDKPIDENLVLGIFLAFKFGALRYYDYQDQNQIRRIELDEDNYENITRIDLSIGLRWRK
ncbi:MAG: hypothetical protein DWQ44_01875 [Bacteroidetes bacterium]|nr:MAG: hypothetical protein DWQ33_05605 [Bacteroidota bacterium]REK04727.1 MAG: hypothetical protein DWQ39_05770 [Bacteroidota bacterium]REK36201.1 MAG: hypothetical protein DWQ44_01875 [Bacteroidota bacterium]REK51428.1 MAG: hypothetical protein DWQ48_00960 [Bacteroidota bacterium]